jgi:glycerophosphoryl diester phosphodiesterase
VRLRHHDTATIPNLTQLADLVRDSAVGLQVEIKGRGRLDLLQRSLAVIDAADIRSRASVIAFDPEIAAAAVTAGGLAGVFWLLDATLLQRIGASGIIEMAAKHGVRAIEADIAVMDTALCDALREAGLRLGAWGANDEAQLLKAFGLKLDVVATDDPVLALRLRQG